MKTHETWLTEGYPNIKGRVFAHSYQVTRLDFVYIFNVSHTFYICVLHKRWKVLWKSYLKEVEVWKSLKCNSHLGVEVKVFLQTLSRCSDSSSSLSSRCSCPSQASKPCFSFQPMLEFLGELQESLLAWFCRVNRIYPSWFHHWIINQWKRNDGCRLVSSILICPLSSVLIQWRWQKPWLHWEMINQGHVQTLYCSFSQLPCLFCKLMFRLLMHDLHNPSHICKYLRKPTFDHYSVWTRTCTFISVWFRKRASR